MPSIDPGQLFLTLWRWTMATIPGVLSEVLLGALNRFVHGFRNHQFSPDPGTIAAILVVNLCIVAAVIGVLYLFDRFLHERTQKLVFILSILVAGFFYPAC